MHLSLQWVIRSQQRANWFTSSPGGGEYQLRMVDSGRPYPQPFRWMVPTGPLSTDLLLKTGAVFPRSSQWTRQSMVCPCSACVHFSNSATFTSIDGTEVKGYGKLLPRVEVAAAQFYLPSVGQICKALHCSSVPHLVWSICQLRNSDHRPSSSGLGKLFQMCPDGL